MLGLMQEESVLGEERCGTHGDERGCLNAGNDEEENGGQEVGLCTTSS